MTQQGDREWEVHFLPRSDAITEATEFAFINGVPFVKASKHEMVVHKHVAENRRLREALEEIANEDFRGNRPWSATRAHQALAKTGKGRDDG